MVEGNPASSLILFAIPMIVGNLFQQLYNIADSIIVGNLVGSDALAAVGASTSITNLFVMVAIGTGIGCSVVISHLYGAGRFAEMKSSISTAMLSILTLSLALSAVGLLLHRHILVWMGTPADVLADATEYLRIYFLGFAFLFLYNATNAVFNALGDSTKPLIFLIASSLLNVFLDLLFVGSFGMGVAGAAWATLISQAISALVSFAVLLRRLRQIRTEAYRRFDPALLKNMIGMAVPTTLQQSIVSIGMLLIQSVVNRFGADFLAGYTAAVKIDSITIVPMVNVGNAVSTFVAQNLGARKEERVRLGYRTGLILAVGIGAAMGICLHFLSPAVIGLFMDEESSQAAIAVGVQYLSVISMSYFIMGAMNVTAAVLRGAGDKKWFLLQSLLNLAARVLLVYLLADATDGFVIMWASGVGWSIGFLISYTRYRQGGWKKIHLV